MHHAQSVCMYSTIGMVVLCKVIGMHCVKLKLLEDGKVFI